MSRDVTLREKGVRKRLGADVGNTVRVSQNFHPRREPRRGNRAVKDGKACTRAPAEPYPAAHKGEQQDDKDRKEQTPEETLSWVFGLAGHPAEDPSPEYKGLSRMNLPRNIGRAGGARSMSLPK